MTSICRDRWIPGKRSWGRGSWECVFKAISLKLSSHQNNLRWQMVCSQLECSRGPASDILAFSGFPHFSPWSISWPSAFSVKLLLLNPLQRVTFSKLELFHMKGEHTCGGFFQFCGITFRSNFRNDFPSLGMAAHRHMFPLNTLFISSYWVFLMWKNKSGFFSLQLKWSQKWTPVTHVLAHLVKTFTRLVSIGFLSVNNGRSPCLLALLGKTWAFFLILILFATYNCSESNQENTKYWFLHWRD